MSKKKVIVKTKYETYISFSGTTKDINDAKVMDRMSAYLLIDTLMLKYPQNSDDLFVMLEVDVKVKLKEEEGDKDKSERVQVSAHP